MKYLLILTLFIPFTSFSQKVNDYKYIHVDTLIQYKDAQIIIYRDKGGHAKSDIVYYSKMKRDIDIEEVSVFISDKERNIKR